MKPSRLRAFQRCGALAVGLTAIWLVLERSANTDSPVVFPGAEWAKATPESQGLDRDQFIEAVEWFDAELAVDDFSSMMVVRNGWVIWTAGDVARLHNMKSVTKTFTGTVFGILVDEGKCRIDTHGSEILPELEAAYSGVTLKHFATMTSGYRARNDDARGSYSHGPSKTPLEPDPVPLFSPPGSRFAYWDSAMNQFGNLLTHVSGESLYDLFNRRIASPIGINSSAWKWGNLGTLDGVPINGGAGNLDAHVEISAEDMARLCHLFLNEGNWSGRQLLSTSWVREATRIQVDAEVEYGETNPKWKGVGAYGLNWWVNGWDRDGRLRLPGVPLGAFYASGHRNRCFVIPDWKMVVVCLGAERTETEKEWGIFLAKIGKAIKR